MLGNTLQYIGQTKSTRGRFGKNYNSPSYLIRSPSKFNKLLLENSPSSFFVTVVALTSPFAAV
jgi:hypothetical protein